ncbi:DUF6346 domain-containing protein [Amycolatopsis lurida]
MSFPVLALLALTLGNLDNQLQRGAEYTVDETGEVAYVRSCEEYGPISHAGFGYHWACSVDHGDPDSLRGLEPASRETLSSIFTPADVGKTFAVKKIGKHIHRYHDDNPFTWARVWVLIPGAFIVFVLFQAKKGRLPNWARPGLAGRLRANPALGPKFIEKLLHQGRLEARPVNPGREAKAVASVEIAGRRSYRIHITKTGVSGKNNDVLTWSLRWAQIEKVELTAFYRLDDRGSEHPIARVMDIYTIPREWGSREPGFKKHWEKMGIQGGARFEYFLSREKALAVNTTVAAYAAIRAKGAKP